MTRKELSQVALMKNELRMWEERIAELRSKSLTGSKEINGMPFANTGEVSDSTFQYISQILELQSKIDEKRLQIEATIAEIEEYIMTIDDSLLRQIIEYRCCQCKTWREVADMIGYCTTENSLKQYFGRRFPN